MKKLLALVLALVMSMSLVTISNAAFSDVDKIDHKEAVEVMNALGVINGMPDGSFAPAGNVTRAEMAKMITIIMLGDIDAAAFKGTATDLTDINGHWAEGYIKYCYSQGVIAGRGDGTFAPNANVTAVEAAKMLLVAIGYNATVQGYVGSQWSINIIRDAQLSKLFADLSVTSTKVLTRDEAAQMIYNAVDADLIEKTPSLNINTGSITYSYKANDNGKDLLSETFKVKNAKGYLTDASYDSNKKTFTYEVKDDITGGSTVVIAPASAANTADALKSSTDYSELFGRTVKVLWSVAKDGTKNVYGIYASDASVAATVGELELGTATADKKVKLAGTEYKLDAAEGSTKVYVFNGDDIDDTTKTIGNVASTYNEASSLTLVDSNDNGKYDYAIVVPATVAKVTYVGTKSITAGGVYTFEDNNIYTGVAKNDYAKIVAAANSVYGKAVLTKADSVEGKVTALKGNDVKINDTWYKLSSNSGDTAAVGNTVKLAVVGGYYYNVETIDGKTLDNVLFVMDAGTYTQGLASGAEAKVMYAKDGTVATVKVSKVGDTTVNAASASETYATAGKLLVGGMYTFVEKNGWLELTKLDNNVVGTSTFVASGATFDKDGLARTYPAVDGKTIADDAVVMAYTTNGSGKSLYTNGKALKAWSTDFGTAGQALYSKVNGVDTIIAVALYETTAALPASDGNTGYGYITADTYFIKEDDTPYAVMSLWTADGQLTGVKAEKLWDADANSGSGANVAPTAANVASLVAAKKDNFVTYEKLANGNIQNVKVIGTPDALEGMFKDKDNNDVLTLTTSGTKIIDKDTKIIYVDTDKKTGAEGSEIALAQETTVSGVYVKNVVVADTDSNGKLEVIFVDVNNNLASNAGSVTAATGAKITSITEGTNQNELKIASGSTGTQVATEAAAWTGALTAVVIDNAGAVKTTGTVAATDTLRVVAEDGTAYTFVINSVA